jgi:hypothetical protein
VDARCCCDIVAMLLRQGRRIDTVLSVIECSPVMGRRALPLWRTVLAVSPAGNSLPRQSRFPVHRTRVWTSARCADGRGSRSLACDRALETRKAAPALTKRPEMSDWTELAGRSRVATQRLESDQVLLFVNEQSELRISASDTPETTDLT